MRSPLRILWLKTGPLHPLDTGGKIRTYHMLRELHRAHEVTFLSLGPAEAGPDIRGAAREYCREALWAPWEETPRGSARFYLDLARNALASRLPYSIAKYASEAMAARIRDLDGAGRQDLVVCDFLTPAINLRLRGRPLRTPTLLFQHNVETLIWQRMADAARGPLRRGYFRLQARRMAAFERESCRLVDGGVGVSDADCERMRRDFGLGNVLGAVPTGVDLAHFTPSTEARRPRTVAFLGSMDWMPNVDGIVWFVAEAWPLVRRRFPDARLSIVGRKPVPAVLELARRDDSVEVTGTVPDVRPHLARAEALVVPLRVGGGTRIKIFEAMATSIPVVSTRIGAEGLPVRHGEDILLADTPSGLAEALGSLFDREELRRSVGQQGCRLVRENFGWPAVAAVFEGYCREVARRRRPVP